MRSGAKLQEFGDTLRAIILDDDLTVWRENVLDPGAIGKTKGERRDKSRLVQPFTNLAFVTRANTKKKIGLAEKRKTKAGMIAIGR